MDLKLSSHGDLVLIDKDLGTVKELEFIKQQVWYRLSGSAPSAAFDADIFANLEDLLGLPNDAGTAAEGIDRIEKALTWGEFLSSDDIYIRAVPLSRDQVSFFVFVSSLHTNTPLGFEVELNLAAGVTFREVQ